VLNAQAAGAVAVIMVNNDQEDPDEEIVMGGSGRKPKIPSVMVSFNSGAALTPNTAATLRKTDPAPLMLDGDLDADVVFHEYGHGLTWRLIGGMSGPLAGAIGEGGGDTLAFLMTRASPGADAIGEYTEGNGKGIRSHRYSLYPAASSYADATQGEVHADGEIYAAIMWDLLELYEANGKTSDDLFARWVDGMKSTPATPKFEDMRDGMLASAEGTDEECLIWRAFAARGVGVGASATVKGKKVTINETFTLPAECPAPPTP
jgi:extracellular elastinolytic metalloproteinase